MDKITFVNGTEPALNAKNLNQLQDNVESSINQLQDNLENSKSETAGEATTITISNSNYEGAVVYVVFNNVCFLCVSLKVISASPVWISIADVPIPSFLNNAVDFGVITQGATTSQIRAGVTSEGVLQVHGGQLTGVDYTASITYPVR